MGGPECRGPSNAHGLGGPAPRIDRGRGYREIQGLPGRQIEVYDLDLAAWILLRGLSVSDAFRSGSEFAVRFYDPDGRIPDLAVDFLNSESQRFASAIRSIKKICIARSGPR